MLPPSSGPSEERYNKVRKAQKLSLMSNPAVSGRMLPVLALVVPTVMYGLLKYLFTIMVRGVASRIMYFSHKHEQQKQVRSCCVTFSVGI